MKTHGRVLALATLAGLGAVSAALAQTNLGAAVRTGMESAIEPSAGPVTHSTKTGNDALDLRQGATYKRTYSGNAVDPAPRSYGYSGSGSGVVDSRAGGGATFGAGSPPR